MTMAVVWQHCFFMKNGLQRMRRWVGACVIAGLAFSCFAEEVQLRAAEYLQAGSGDLTVGTFAIPCVTDWNGDGKKDLLVGYQTAGKIALYLNTETNDDPVFSATPTLLKANGVDIQYTSSGCGSPCPFVCDYDNDGKRDLLVGQGANGYVYFYRNTNRDSDPVLAAPIQLKEGSNLLTVTWRATPYTCDWDGDGKIDLLCGCGDGWVYFYKNIGTAQSPTNATGTRIKAAGTDLFMGIRSVVRVFDWDGDGLQDLVGSSSNSVYWCRNTNTVATATPLLAAPTSLRSAASAGGLANIFLNPTGTARMRLDVCDWNNDGATDLLIGISDGKVALFKGYRFAFSIISTEPCGGHVFQWNSTEYLYYDIMAGDTITGITNRVAANIKWGGESTTWTNVCGMQSQFYRIKIAQ